MNRLDIRTANASTASCGGVVARVIGMTGMTTTTPPAIEAFERQKETV